MANHLGALLGALTVDGCVQEKEERKPATPEDLLAISQHYRELHTFKKDDLVMWKPRLKNARLPEYGEPVIILEVSQGRKSTQQDPDHCQFDEPHDIRVGVIMENGNFNTFWLDARRFQPYTSSSTVEQQKSNPAATPLP